MPSSSQVFNEEQNWEEQQVFGALILTVGA